MKINKIKQCFTLLCVCCIIICSCSKADVDVKEQNECGLNNSITHTDRKSIEYKEGYDDIPFACFVLV